MFRKRDSVNEKEEQKRIHILVLIIFLVIGFASVTSVLVINQNVNIAYYDGDFKIYFSGAILDGTDRSNQLISDDKQTITFNTRELTWKDEESTLEYEVTNESTMYDADVKVVCDGLDDGNIKIDTNPSNHIVKAGKTENGLITITLVTPVVSSKQLDFECRLVADATGRESIENVNIENKIYALTGYLVNENDEIVPEENIVVFLKDGKVLTTDNNGYLYLDNLDRGSYEIFYVGKENVDGKTKEEIKDIALGYAEFETGHTGDIILSNGYRITDALIITNIVNNGLNVTFRFLDGSEQVKTVIQNHPYGELPETSRPGYVFTGWYIKDMLIKETTLVTIKQDEVALTTWEKGKFTITFNNGGEEYSTKVVTYDEPYGELPEPTKEGYTFDGWYLDEEYTKKITSTDVVKITEDANIYAKWIANKLNITFKKVKEDAIISIDSKEVTYNKPYGELPIPTLTGYTFAGWYLDEEYTNKITSTDIVKIKNDSNVYAKWEANSYTVTYNANGGVLTETSKKVTYDSKYEELPTPEREGYTFAGWYLDDEKITSSTIVRTGKDHTIIAKWEANTYTIKFDTDGGNTIGSIVVTYDSAYGELPVPTKAGYTFAGWYKEDEQITKDSIVDVLSETTLKAHWNANTNTPYQVNHYIEKIGKDASKHDTDNYDLKETDYLNGTTNTKVSPNVKTYEGFTSPSKEEITIAGNGTTVLNYYYTRNSYDLTIDKSIGVASVTGAGKIEYGDTVTIGYTIQIGYTFTGITGDYTVNSFVMPANEVNVKVNAKANEYTITFDKNDEDATLDTLTKKVTYASTYGDLPTPEKYGYTFKGWYLDTNYTEEITASSIVNITTDKTLYAKWIVKVSTVTFETNGGSTVNTTLSVTFGSTYGTLPAPTKTGYTFDGWYLDDSTFNNKITGESTVDIIVDTILYAKWTPITYTITYNLNGGSASDNPTSYTIETPTITLNNPTKANYNFIGWEGTDINSATTSVIIPKGSTGNKTFTAQFQAATYVLTFNANGGTLVGDSQKTVTYGETYGTLPTATKTDYRFIGWYTVGKTSAPYDEDEFTSDGIVDITQNETLYAQFTKECTLFSYPNDNNLYNIVGNKSYGTDVCNGIDYGSTEGRGVFTIDSTRSDTYPIHFFRENVNNNYLRLSDMCFRIVRTTDTGGVKAIYNGIYDTTTGSCRNSGDDVLIVRNERFNNYTIGVSYDQPDNAYVGYMYGSIKTNNYTATHANTNDSTAKKAVESWYREKMNDYDYLLEDTVYCNDRSVIKNSSYSSYRAAYNKKETFYAGMERLYMNRSPSLTCENANDRFSYSTSVGNGKLGKKVGLLTADEASYGGLVWNTTRRDTYLWGVTTYWLMTPNSYYAGGPRVFYVREDGGMDTTWTNEPYIGLRPVISFKNSTEILGGTGMANNPYVIVD